jgi:two-component system phosphate regulon response regulator PhoB
MNATPADKRATAAEPVVLVIDDEPDLLELVKHQLQKEHYEVTTALDGEVALTQARRQPPDLVVLDLMLPGIDGLEVCRRLRADPRTMHIPIVMLTAKGEESDAVIGLSQGADDYIRKPFGSKELVARIAARLRASRGATLVAAGKVVSFGDLVIDPV